MKENLFCSIRIILYLFFKTFFFFCRFLRYEAFQTVPPVTIMTVACLFNAFLFVSVLFHQLLRKRHIGNDIVTIVFQEPGALPFTPKSIRSHFQHVFIIVQVHEPCTDKTYYRSVKRCSKCMHLFFTTLIDLKPVFTGWNLLRH